MPKSLSSALPGLKQQLQQCETEIRNVMEAIRLGIITDTTTECLEDLEAQRESPKESIAQLQLERCVPESGIRKGGRLENFMAWKYNESRKGGYGFERYFIERGIQRGSGSISRRSGHHCKSGSGVRRRRMPSRPTPVDIRAAGSYNEGISWSVGRWTP